MLHRDRNAPHFELVSAVHSHGWATVTSPAVAQLLAQGTPVIWRGATGYPIGFAAPLHQAGLEARRAQYAAGTGAQGLGIARALVRAKIVNMRGLVRRRAALAGRGSLADLEHHARRAETAPTLDTLLGIEGAATALYFAAWPQMISARAGDLTLDGRTRRPPQDEVNALPSPSSLDRIRYAESSPPTEGWSKRMPASPMIEITYCRLCGWGLRAGWMAQELLMTFAEEVGSVALTPDATGGLFEVRVDGDLVWSRKQRGRFPDIKELKQLLRDRIAPGRSLGHVDRPS